MRHAQWPGAKLRAALERRYFRTADLFAGCGGMTLGFHRAKYRCVVAVEKDDAARASHEANFAVRAPVEGYAAHADITVVHSMDAVAHLGRTQPERRDAVDIVIGGPPCQAFSRLGRAALWDIAGRKHAHAEDPRATLYEHFLSYVEDLQPIAFVMENVPEIGRFSGKNVAEEIATAAEKDLGYVTRYALLNAAWYGVPQFRERMFIIGVRREFGLTPSFPPRTHSADIPSGYATARAGARRDGVSPVLAPCDRYVEHAAEAVGRTRRTPTAGQAFRDLPEIILHLDEHEMQNGGRRTVRDPALVQPYAKRACGYSEQMRNWPDFKSNGGAPGHAIRLTPRDYPIFRRMRPGDMYPQAVAIAEQLLADRIQRETRRGVDIRVGSAAWEALRAEIVPPYAMGRFENKFRKMAVDEPARTVPAHLGKDCYSHIHPDSRQARTISIREAARLQSFPDAFELRGGMNAQFTQIGNAVPPLLAHAIASHLRAELRRAAKRLST